MIDTEGSPEEWLSAQKKPFTEPQLTGLITVERFLASRGFEVEKTGNGEDTIIPKTPWTFDKASIVFQVFHDLDRRKELKNYILNQEKQKPEDIEELSELTKRVTSIPEFTCNSKAFSHTFEWYVSELIKWKFRAFDSEYGIEIKDIKNKENQNIGDYDVLAILGNLSLLYIECKTGNFDKNDIIKSIERSRSIHCIASIMFLGKPYRRDEIKKILCKIENRETFGLQDQNQFHELGSPENSNSEIYKWNDCYFIPAKIGTVNVEDKIRTTLRLIAYCDPSNQRVSSPNYQNSEFAYTIISLLN